ncbi:unnamed protein product [Rotaria sordida]|uniref:Uncharacterized protein n=1 Tax=Rotaria sordida TaxID=392033 RepID=A0A813UYI4_9BILA|nr:unnamed protein product [Rotaria sordida]
MYRYIFDRNEWKIVHCTNSSHVRSAHSVAIYQNTMYLFGGIELKYNNDSRVIPAKCDRHTCILSGENLYMFDGYVGIQRSNELFVLNL